MNVADALYTAQAWNARDQVYTIKLPICTKIQLKLKLGCTSYKILVIGFSYCYICDNLYIVIFWLSVLSSTAGIIIFIQTLPALINWIINIAVSRRGTDNTDTKLGQNQSQTPFSTAFCFVD